MLIACTDVHYSQRGCTAACVVFDSWKATSPLETVVRTFDVAAAYAAGEFYRRELPPILGVLRELPRQPEVVIVDGYVWLGENRPGLGAHLYDALGQHSSVIGVAKSSFRDAPAIALLRGASKTPLYVTSAGMPPDEAAQHVGRMSGAFRIPTLIKLADQLSRSR